MMTAWRRGPCMHGLIPLLRVVQKTALTKRPSRLRCSAFNGNQTQPALTSGKSDGKQRRSRTNDGAMHQLNKKIETENKSHDRERSTDTGGTGLPRLDATRPGEGRRAERQRNSILGCAARRAARLRVCDRVGDRAHHAGPAQGRTGAPV
jgi:hypothetical protein